MPLSDRAQQDLIVQEVGDLDGAVSGAIGNIWLLYDDKVSAPRLRFFYAKLHALAILEGLVREQVNFAQAGVLQESSSDKLRALVQMIAETEKRIDLIEKQARGNRFASVGRITATAPVMPTDPAANPYQAPTFPADGNDPRITGSPYLRPLVMR